MSNLAQEPTIKKRLPAAERREQIFAVAREAFGERGYDGVTLDEIAAAAGVTKPVIYRHFGSKDDLYLALLERHREDLPRFLTGLDPEQPFEDLVRAILDGWYAYADANGPTWRMLFRDAGGTAAIQEARATMYEDARGVLAAFLRFRPEFDIPEDRVELTAELIRGALSNSVLLAQERPALTRSDLVESGARLIAGLADRSRPPKRSQ